MKTSELSGVALDWAVSVIVENSRPFPIWLDGKPQSYAAYSTDWAQGGPIIESTCASVFFDIKDASYAGHPDEPWFCEMGDMGGMWHGQTPLIAAMRCYVASRLGEEVDIPDELKEK